LIGGGSLDRQLVSRDHLERQAVYDAASSRWLSYTDLLLELRDLAQVLRFTKARSSNDKSLVFCFARNDIHSLKAYLTTIEYGHTVCLLDARLDPELKLSLVQTYNPEFVVDAVDEGGPDAGPPVWNELYNQINGDKSWWRRKHSAAPGTYMPPLHRNLTLLLPTSGSTGSPKLVRLSFVALICNARSIASALSINENERAITSLPMHYSYGLSVINSHLQVGASIVLAEPDLLSNDYWKLIADQQCTSMAGVPYSYEVLNRLDLEKLKVPSLKTLTQAGGKLNPKLIEKFAKIMEERKGKFYVMYGQTEATARIAILPPERLWEKLGSVGAAIPWGELLIETEDGNLTKEPNISGQVVYRGPNVMFGYAQSREDLALGDYQENNLLTGDIGHLDNDGFLYITGRSKRIAKVLGYRLNLDDIENWLGGEFPVAAVAGDDKVLIFTESSHQDQLKQQARTLAKRLKLNSALLECRFIEEFPRKHNGKVDYQRLVDA
jgi:acyl-CoA synthetase (AMP-forming)/AMP-acid ligase II